MGQFVLRAGRTNWNMVISWYRPYKEILLLYAEQVVCSRWTSRAQLKLCINQHVPRLSVHHDWGVNNVQRRSHQGVNVWRLTLRDIEDISNLPLDWCLSTSKISMVLRKILVSLPKTDKQIKIQTICLIACCCWRIGILNYVVSSKVAPSMGLTRIAACMSFLTDQDPSRSPWNISETQWVSP